MTDDDGAKRRAKRMAKKRAKRTLDELVCPVPCPTCGWYQREMVSILQGLQYRWMRTLALIILATSPIVFLTGVIVSDVVLGRMGIESQLIDGLVAVSSTLALVISLLVARRIRQGAYSPNQLVSEERRLELGGMMACPRDDMPVNLPLVTRTGRMINASDEF